MRKRFFALILGAMVLYGCGGSNGSGVPSAGGGATSENSGGDTTEPVPMSVQVRMGEVDLLDGTFNVYMTNDAPVHSFSFSVQGVLVKGATTEVFAHGASVLVSGNQVSGSAEAGRAIPSGEDQLLTTISFTSDYQSVGISFSEDSFVTDASGVKVDPAMVTWIEGTSVWMSIEPDYQNNVLNVYLENLLPVGGFQFVLAGDIQIEDVVPSSDVVPASFSIANSSDMVLAYTAVGGWIPEGERRLLLQVHFTTKEKDPPVSFDLETFGCVVSDEFGDEPATCWGAE